MVKLDFLVPGFSKCGTTTLCSLLSQHPEIYIPELKEPWYFSASDYPDKQNEYVKHFAPAEPQQKLGEGSVSYSGYLKEDLSISRILENNPRCRMIFIARNPLRRIESSYREMHHSGVQFGLNAPYSLGENLEVFPQMINDSLFFERISKWVTAFGEQSILVVFLEDLQRDPARELLRCFKHLGVDPGFKLQDQAPLNAGNTKYYDTKLLRYLRCRPWSGFKLAKLNPVQQDRLFIPLGLRKAFRKAVIWDEHSLQMVRARVQPDSSKFLKVYGKPSDFWKI
ncbi:MAG: sulfotransferase [Pseudomonadota bacterium]